MRVKHACHLLCAIVKEKVGQGWEWIEATPPQNQALKPTTSYFRTIPKQKQAKDIIIGTAQYDR